MSYEKLARQLAQVLARDNSHLLNAQQRRPRLAGYASLGAVLAALEESQGYSDKEWLTRVLLEEHQRDGNPYWAHALLTAYAPMLGNLRRRLRSEVLDREDLDQLVLLAFLEAVRTFPLRTRLSCTCMALRQSTSRQVFQRLRALHRLQAVTDALEPEGVAPPPSVSVEDRLTAHEIWERGQGELSPEARAVLVATIEGDASLRELAQAGNPADVQREYERLKRQRQRALAKLRGVL